MLRICDVCGVIDDLPRHVHGTFGLEINQAHISAVLDRSDLASDERARIIAEISDTTLQQRHFTCCAETGCPAAGDPADCANLI
jgi:hypothetical protein